MFCFSVTRIEYILISGENDTHDHAHALGALLRPRRADVLLNLIPYNPTEAGNRVVMHP
jgi:adenine C2-methylase RlmN of 23S rRNA A2503 and tRNA A37